MNFFIYVPTSQETQENELFMSVKSDYPDTTDYKLLGQLDSRNNSYVEIISPVQGNV